MGFCPSATQFLVNASFEESLRCLFSGNVCLPVFVVLGVTLSRADEAALRATIVRYVNAFNDQDLQSVADIWTETATHVDRETGERTEGRDAILNDIQTAFREQPNIRLSGQVDSVRMITADVAKVDGQTLVGVPGQPPIESTFSAIAVQKDGKWMIDSIEEMPLPQPPTSYDALQKLGWLEGKWVDQSDVTRVDTTVSWSPNRAFLIRSFAAQSEQGEQRGTQVIGWDPRSREIRSWTFHSDGSFGDGVWAESGNDWLIKSSQTTADGLAASGTYVLTRTDDDTIEMQLIAHEIEGEPQPNSDVVIMVREKQAPEQNEPSPESTSAAPASPSNPAEPQQGVDR